MGSNQSEGSEESEAAKPFFYRQLPGGSLIDGNVVGAAWRTARSGAQPLGVKLQLGDGAAESIAVHPKQAGGFALIAFAVLQNGENKAFLEFAHRFRVRDSALVHLHDQSFQLIFHNASLFAFADVVNVPAS
jgi:hypothetical protein